MLRGATVAAGAGFSSGDGGLHLQGEANCTEPATLNLKRNSLEVLGVWRLAEVPRTWSTRWRQAKCVGICSGRLNLQHVVHGVCPMRQDTGGVVPLGPIRIS